MARRRPSARWCSSRVGSTPPPASPWRAREGFEAHCLSVDYGQRHKGELRGPGGIARALGAADHRVVRVDLSAFGGSALTDRPSRSRRGAARARMARDIPVTYVPARNTVLLALALAHAETIGAEDVFVGVNAIDYSGYPDCRPAFLRAFERLARVATQAGVEGRPLADPRAAPPALQGGDRQARHRARRAVPDDAVVLRPRPRPRLRPLRRVPAAPKGVCRRGGPGSNPVREA